MGWTNELFNVPDWLQFTRHNLCWCKILLSFYSNKDKHVESHFLVPQILVGPEAEEEGDDKDGEDEAVDHANPQPDAHTEFEPSGDLGTKWIEVVDCVSWKMWPPPDSFVQTWAGPGSVLAELSLSWIKIWQKSSLHL